MKARDRVEESPERVARVVLPVARAAGVLHQEGAAVAQRPGDRREHGRGLGPGRGSR